MEGSGPKGTRALAALSAWQVGLSPGGLREGAHPLGWVPLPWGSHRAAELTVQGMAQVGLCHPTAVCPWVLLCVSAPQPKIGTSRGSCSPGKLRAGGGEGREMMQLFSCVCSQVLAGSPMPTLISPCF